MKPSCIPCTKTGSTALLVKSFILLPIPVISKHLKSLRVAQTLVRGQQMWHLPFWKSSWNSQLILGRHFCCPCWTTPSISWQYWDLRPQYIYRSLQLSKWPLSPFCTSLKFSSNVYAATSFFYYLSTRCPALSLLCICTLACVFCLDIFRLTQHLLCWLTYSVYKLSLLPTSFPSETFHMAPRQGMRSILPPIPLLFLGGDQRLEISRDRSWR